MMVPEGKEKKLGGICQDTDVMLSMRRGRCTKRDGGVEILPRCGITPTREFTLDETREPATFLYGYM
jgi:hypothetical protein